MRVLSTLLLLAAATALAAAPPVVTAPAKVYGETGDWVEVKVTVDGAKAVKFVPLDDGLAVFPADKLRDELTTFVRGKEGKAYKLLVYAGNADGASAPVYIEAVFIDSPQPNPNPNPGPNPPTPKVDPQAKALIDAYGVETAPDKKARVAALAKAMRQAATLAGDATITTNSALAARVAKNTDATVEGYLIGVRKEIGNQMKTEFPTDVVTLTPELRAKFQAAYNRVAQALEGIGSQ